MDCIPCIPRYKATTVAVAGGITTITIPATPTIEAGEVYLRLGVAIPQDTRLQQDFMVAQGNSNNDPYMPYKNQDEIYGLCKDGTAVAFIYSDSDNKAVYESVREWKNLKCLYPVYHGCFGITNDGRVLYDVHDEDNWAIEDLTALSEWENISEIVFFKYYLFQYFIKQGIFIFINIK